MKQAGGEGDLILEDNEFALDWKGSIVNES